MERSTVALFLMAATLLASGPALGKPPAGSLRVKISHESTYVSEEDTVLHTLIQVHGAKTSTRSEQTVNLALVIDRSGSMLGQKMADAKAAAMGMVSRLRDGDRVAIVSYSDSALIDWPSVLVDSDSRPMILSAIQRIQAQGGTNLSHGLLTAYGQVRQHLNTPSVHRVLLISDGLANRGITAVPELNRLAQRAGQERIVTSTLGLGTDYNEDLMTAVANNGGGNYHFVQHSGELARVLNSELAQMMSTVARGVTLTLNLPEGLIVEEVYGYVWRQTGSQITVELGDMFSAQTRGLLWKIRLSDGEGPCNLGSLSVDYEDSLKDNRPSRLQRSLEVKRTKSDRRIRRGQNPEVAARVAEIQFATRLKTAAGLVHGGDYEGARTEIQRARAEARERSQILGVKGHGASLAHDSQQAESLLEDLETAPTNPGAERALIKRSKARAYSIQKR